MILTALLLGGLLQGSLQNRPAHDSSSQATAEGIEILRRILADQIDATLAPEERDGEHGEKRHRLRMFGVDGSGPVTSLLTSGQTVSHSRAFHVPGRGVLVCMDLSLPTVVRQAEETEPEEPRAPSDDEWEEMRRRVRGGPEDHVFLRGKLLQPGQDSEIDEKAIERVRETVIKTVARHASRIEGLGRDEVVTVALHLSGETGTWWSGFESTPFGVFGGVEDDGSPDRKNDDEEGLAQTYTYAVTARTPAPEQHFVLEIPLADLDEFAQGGYSRLAPRVRVSRY